MFDTQMLLGGFLTFMDRWEKADKAERKVLRETLVELKRGFTSLNRAVEMFLSIDEDQPKKSLPN